MIWSVSDTIDDVEWMINMASPHLFVLSSLDGCLGCAQSCSCSDIFLLFLSQLRSGLALGAALARGPPSFKKIPQAGACDVCEVCVRCDVCVMCVRCECEVCVMCE